VAVGSLLRFPRPAPPLPPPAFGCGSSLPVGNYNVAMLMAFSSFFMHTYMYMHPHTHIQDSQTASSSSLQGHSRGLGSGLDRGWKNGRGQWLVTSAFLQEVVRFFIIPFLLFEFLQTLIALAFVQVKLIKRRKERVIITKSADYKT